MRPVLRALRQDFFAGAGVAGVAAGGVGAAAAGAGAELAAEVAAAGGV